MFASLDPVRHPPADTIIAFRSAASTVFRNSMATVIGPHPAGHGREVPGDGRDPLEVDVADGANLPVIPPDPVDPDVNDDRAGGGEEDVGLAPR